MKNDIVIVGAGGFGREVAWLIERINHKNATWNILGFIDDNDDIQGEKINGYKVIGKIDDAINLKNAYFICTIGSSQKRRSVVERIENILPEAKFAMLIDPTVEISRYNNVGDGVIICAQTLLTVNIDIGKHVIINLDCTIGHDAVISEYSTLYPSVNISGHVHLGRACEIGTGTQIIQGKSIGNYSIIGAGAVVVKDIPEKCTAVGAPAKPIKFFEI